MAQIWNAGGKGSNSSNKPRNGIRQNAGAIIGLAVIAGLAGQSQAQQNDAWSTAPTNGTFSGVNWVTGSTTSGPANGTIASSDSLFFGTSSITTLTDDEAAGFSLSGITFNSGASAFNISGNAISLGGNIVNSSASAQIINNNITLNNNVSFTATTVAGTLTVGGNVTDNGAGFTLTTGGGTSAASNIADITTFTGSVSVASLVLQGNSGNSPPYAADCPSTIFNNASLSTTGNVVVGRGNLVFQGSTTANIAGNLGTTGAASADWANITITGTANVTAGTVNLNGSTATGQLNLDGGTLTTGFVHAVNRVQGNNNDAGLTLSGTQIVASASAAPFMSVTAGAGGANQAYIGTGGALFNTSTFSIGIPTNLVNLTTALTGAGVGTGATAGNGFVVVSGSGTLTLSGNNTYTGGTTVNQGTLTIGSATGLGATSGPLAVNNNNATATGTSTVLNLWTSAGTTVGSLSGTIATPTSGTNTATINNGGQLFTVNQTTSATYAGGITGAGGFTLNGSSGVTLELSGSSSYTGVTTIKTGTLDIAGPSATSGISLSVTGGNLQLGVGGSVPNLSSTSYTGNTVGKLILGDSGGANSQTITSNLGMTGTNSIVTGSSAASTLTLNGSGTVTFANAFGGAGTNQNSLNLIIAGTGTTPTSTLTGTSTYTGTTVVNSGSTLNLANAVLGNTALTVSNGGTLTGTGNNSSTGIIGGTVTAAGGSAITLGTTASTALKVTGGITLGDPTNSYANGFYSTLNYTLGTSNAVEALNTLGTLALNPGGAFVNIISPTIGTFTLANYGSLTGGSGFSLSNTTSGVLRQTVGLDVETLTVGANALTLAVTGAPNPNVAYFDGAAGTSIWTSVSGSAVNWSSNLAGTTSAGNIPASNTDVILTASNKTGALATNLGASTTINSLNVNGNATNTINADGNVLTINAFGDSNTDTGGGYTGNIAGTGISIANGSNPFTLNAPLLLGNSQLYVNKSASLFTVGGTIGGTASSGSTQTLTLSNTNAGGTTINGVISDGANLGKLALNINNTGSGITQLTGSNTFTGGTTLTAGNVLLGNVIGLSTGTVTVNGGQLDLGGFSPAFPALNGSGGAITDSGSAATLTANNGSFAGAINDGAGQVSLVKNTSGTLALTGSSNYSGGTSLNAGVLQVNSGSSLGNPGGSLTFNGGALQLLGSFSTTRNYAIGSATATIDTQAFNLTDSGNISGSSATGLTKLGTGILSLGGSNTYAGTTTVTAGTLQLASANALPTGNSVANTSLTVGGTLDLNSYNLTVTTTNTGGAGPGGSGTITNLNGNSSTSTLTLAGAFGGTLKDGVGSGTGSGVMAVVYSNAGNNSTIAVGNANNYTGGTIVANGVRLVAQNVSALGSGTVTVQSGAELAMQANVSNNFSIAGNGSPSDLPVYLGAIRMFNTTETGTITLAADATLGAKPGNGTFSGQITGPFNLFFFGGTNILNNTTANPNNWGGATTINGYVGSDTSGNGNSTTLQLGASQQIPSTSSLTVDQLGTFDLHGFNDSIDGLNGFGTVNNSGAGGSTLTVGANGGSGDFSGLIENTSGQLSLAKIGSGTQTLSGVNETYTGSTIISAGVLALDGSSGISASSVLVFNGTGVLALGDSNGASNLTIIPAIPTATAASAIVAGPNGTSTVTLNPNGVATYAVAFGGAGSNQNNLNLQINGAGTSPTATLTGVSTYTGTTTINGGSTLNLNGGVLGNTAVTVNNGATLTGSGNNLSTGIIGGTVTALGGSTIALGSTAHTALNVTVGITLGDPNNTYSTGNYTTLSYTLGASNAVEALNTPATLTLNPGGALISVVNPTVGTYTLANYGSLVGDSGFSLSSSTAGVLTQSVGRDTETLTVGVNALTLAITGAANPNVAYFDGAVSTIWNDASSPTTVNWSSNLAGTTDAGNTPGANTDVILTANNQTGSVTTTLGGSVTINSLNVNGNATNTINADGSTLTINGVADHNTDSGGNYTGNPAGNGISIASSASAFTINVPIIVSSNGASQIWTNAAANLFQVNGTVSGSAPVGQTQTLTLVNTGAGGTTINGAVVDGAGGGALALSINGSSGVTTLAGNNSYSGGTTLTAGTLLLGNSSALGIGPVTLNSQLDLGGNSPTIGGLSGSSSGVITNSGGGATLTVNGGGSYAGAISDGSGQVSLVKNGNGTLTLSGADTFSGTTTINGGILKVGSPTALPATTLTGGNNLVINSTLDLNGNSVAFVSNPPSGNGTITNAAGNTSTTMLTLPAAFAGNLTDGVGSGTPGSGVLAVTYNASGTVTTITPPSLNNYTGGTVVASGVRLVDTSGSALGTGTITVLSGGQMVPQALLSNNYIIAGNGALTDTPALGAIRFTFNESETGTITLGGDATLGSERAVGTYQGQITGPHNLYLLSGLFGGTIVLDNTTANPDNYTGTTTINGWVGSPSSGEASSLVRLGAPNQIPSTSTLIINAGGILDMNGQSNSVDGLNGVGTIDDQTTTASFTLQVGSNNGSGTFGGVIQNTTGILSLTKAGNGTQILSGVNTYSGNTAVNNGNLTFANATAFPAGTNLSIGSVTPAAAALASHSGGGAGVLQVNALSLSGTTGASTGLLDLTNNAVTVHAGSLATITAEVKQGYSAAGNWQGSGGITSSAAAADTTHLTAVGVIVNDGGSGVPLYGAGGSINSTFEGATPVDGDILVKYTYYGDANLDGKIDGSDYSRIDNGFLSHLSGWYNGDFNYDGVVNGSDYTLIDNAFNTQGAQISAEVASATAQIAGAGASSAVPEPASLGLIGIGVVGLLGRRGRRHR